MPHDKHALNFLINEYLLEQSYKMTSVTFSEENETQDLEDWDVIGLNRAKPPNLPHIYKMYTAKTMPTPSVQQVTSEVTPPIVVKVETTDAECQCDEEEAVEQRIVETACKETNTAAPPLTRHFEQSVNFDKETFETQRMQVDNLLEKQAILLKSIASLDSHVKTLSAEREGHLRKIDLL